MVTAGSRSSSGKVLNIVGPATANAADRKCRDDVEVRYADDVQRSVDAAVKLPD